MPKTTDTILTKTVTPGKGGTRVRRDKYDAVRAALLEHIPQTDDGIAFGDLPRIVQRVVAADLLPKSGSASWLTTTVKLDLEARRLIERVPGTSPQRLRRVVNTRG